MSNDYPFKDRYPTPEEIKATKKQGLANAPFDEASSDEWANELSSDNLPTPEKDIYWIKALADTIRENMTIVEANKPVDPDPWSPQTSPSEALTEIILATEDALTRAKRLVSNYK